MSDSEVIWKHDINDRLYITIDRVDDKFHMRISSKQDDEITHIILETENEIHGLANIFDDVYVVIDGLMGGMVGD